jgi:hypothetical protein
MRRDFDEQQGNDSYGHTDMCTSGAGLGAVAELPHARNPSNDGRQARPDCASSENAWKASRTFRGFGNQPGRPTPVGVQLLNLAADLKPGEVQSWVEALYRQRSTNFIKDHPFFRGLRE